MGDKVDHWFKTYGTAVLNDTLREGSVLSNILIKYVLVFNFAGVVLPLDKKINLTNISGMI